MDDRLGTWRWPRPRLAGRAIRGSFPTQPLKQIRFNDAPSPCDPGNSADDFELAAEPVVKDGGTIQLAGTTYRLDGIDAPELDQMCVDDHADPWTCGVEARDR